MSRIGAAHLARDAVVYVRQSTPGQLRHNHESRRRQYGLAERARSLGWREPVVIDEDLGRSGGGTSRPGFERLRTLTAAESGGCRAVPSGFFPAIRQRPTAPATSAPCPSTRCSPPPSPSRCATDTAAPFQASDAHGIRLFAGNSRWRHANVTATARDRQPARSRIDLSGLVLRLTGTVPRNAGTGVTYGKGDWTRCRKLQPRDHGTREALRKLTSAIGKVGHFTNCTTAEPPHMSIERSSRTIYVYGATCGHISFGFRLTPCEITVENGLGRRNTIVRS